MSRIDWLEIQELAAHITGVSEDNPEWDDAIENKMAETYGISMESFEMLVKQLAPLCTIGQSPITKTMYRGFAVEEGSVGRWLAKVEVE